MSATLCVLGILHCEPPARPTGARAGGRESALEACGKAARQAVAASRLGARVTLIGAVTDGEIARALRSALAAEGIDLAHVQSAVRAEAGVSVANVEQAWSAIAAADVLLVHGELAPEVTLQAMHLARRSNTLVLYEVAPARELPEGFLAQVDVLVARSGEAAELLGDTTREVSPPGLVRRLASLGPERVVLALGGEGAYHFDGETLVHVAGFASSRAALAGSGALAPGVEDAFVAALAVLRAEGARLKDAVRQIGRASCRERV